MTERSPNPLERYDRERARIAAELAETGHRTGAPIRRHRDLSNAHLRILASAITMALTAPLATLCGMNAAGYLLLQAASGQFPETANAPSQGDFVFQALLYLFFTFLFIVALAHAALGVLLAHTAQIHIIGARERGLSTN